MNNIERKIGALGCSSCLLSLNATSLGVAVDACRSARYLELLLEQWQECLPLGEAHDVNFASWGTKVWQMMMEVRRVYSLHACDVNPYEYESESFQTFKEHQQEVYYLDGNLSVLQSVTGDDVPVILICAMRELHEVLMELSEFLNSPTEELIATSFQKWADNYKKHYQRKCGSAYHRWKIQYSLRTLKKHLQERMKEEVQAFKSRFINDDEFDLVFDMEQHNIDMDGLSRYLFTHAERFGVSYIDPKPMFSKELQELFNFIELWRLMQGDLQPAKKRGEQPAVAGDEVEEKVMQLVSKVYELSVEQWKAHLPGLWKRIYHKFRAEISKAGPHEKFREYSKKTIYCIIGHLKTKGVYRSSASNVEITRCLEGANNGMRKYVNNGLTELEDQLADRLMKFIGEELRQVA